MDIGRGVRVGMTALGLATAVLAAAPIEAYAQTQGMERRGDRRDTRQTARQTGRDVKQACKASGDSRASCRQDKRDTKQGIRQEGRATR